MTPHSVGAGTKPYGESHSKQSPLAQLNPSCLSFAECALALNTHSILHWTSISPTLRSKTLSITFKRSWESRSNSTRRRLADAGVTPDTTLTFKLKNVKVRIGLRHMLAEKDLAFLVDHEVLLITTADVGKQKTVTLLYPVGDLIDSPDFSTLGKNPYDVLTDAITSTVCPSSWDTNGGSGSIAPFAVCKVLVISQTDDIHREIQEMLSSLRSVRKNLPESAAVVSNAPVLRVYRLPWKSADGIADETEGQQMVDMVRKLIAPKSWTDANAYIGFIHGALSVRQMPDVHRRIKSFMGGLSGTETRYAAAKAAPAAVPKADSSIPAPTPSPKVPTPPATLPPGLLPSAPSQSSTVAPAAH